MEDGSEEKWAHYTPEAGKVSISINHTEDDLVAEVKIRFRNLGYRVKGWGNVSKENGVLSVNTEIERYTGPAGQTIKTVENSYSLGDLEGGEYEFQFMAWNEDVTNIEFSISED